MKLNATVTIRKDWDAHSVQAFDLGNVTPVELAAFLVKYTDNETLVVQIQLWNRDKIERINARE